MQQTKPKLTANQQNPSLPRHAFETLGKKLAKFTQNKGDFQTFSESQKYQSVDLARLHTAASQDYRTNKNAFHDQIPKLSKRLFGNTKFGEVGTLAGKIVAPETLEKISDKTFLQLGKLAQSWAETDLRHDKRLKGKALNIHERHALAQAIAHQNRGLVAVGSVSNLAGLVGILGDTTWLLLVALRSIFQIASIYDKPLTGKAGIRIAYEILAKADLDKLQEKQTLLAGIGVVEAIVDNNATTVPVTSAAPVKHSDLAFRPFRPFTDFKTDLKNGDYKKLTKFADDTATEQKSMLATAMSYVHNVESIARKMNLNLRLINLGKFNKALPIAAVGIGVSYNNVIIDEIFNIALATFAPEPKMTNVADMDNSEKDNSQKDNSEKLTLNFDKG